MTDRIDALRALKKAWRRIFRHHRGMIRPNVGMGFADSAEIMRRKSAHMVFYLRSRRTLVDYTEYGHVHQAALANKRWARKEHLQARALIAQDGGSERDKP